MEIQKVKGVKSMNLYLIETEDWSWDEYDSAIISAEDEATAIGIWNDTPNCNKHTLCRAIAKDTEEIRGFVLGSFNAG